MSCGCNNSTYSSTCCPEVPYPQISSESVPSLIDNLVYALYGTINKSIVNGRVIWDIPCDPASSPAEVPGVPRNEGEGLLCYIIRVLDEDIALAPNVVDTISAQTITGQKTFTQNIIGNVVGDIFASNGTTKILENGTGSNATFTGNVTGNVAGDVTGNVTGNITGNITGNVTGNVTGNLTGNVTGSASLNVLKSGDTISGGVVVSVNTSTDALRVTQIGTGAAMRIEDSANPDSSPFIVTASGDVGIGVSVPVSKLHVNGAIYCQSLSIGGSVIGTQSIPSFTARIKGDIADITSISTITYFAFGSGATVTITRSSHGLLSGDSITFNGQTGNNAALNGTWVIQNTDTNNFTFTIPTFPASLSAAGITVSAPIRPVRIISSFDPFTNTTSIGRDANGSYQINFNLARSDANYITIGNCCTSGSAAGIFSPFGYSTGFFQFRTYTIGTSSQANFSDINVVIY